MSANDYTSEPSRIAIVAALVSLACCAWRTALAAPHEIKVLTDQIADRGKHSLEVHANVARPPPANRRGHVWQVMPEYSYGFARNWEMSLQLPFSRRRDDFYANGVAAEVQYVAPHDRHRGIYWGANAEVSYASPIDERPSWAIELLPIVGARFGQFHFAMNPALEFPITGDERKVAFRPAAMLTYTLNASDDVGLEYYSDLGPLRNFAPRDEQERMLYAVWNRSGRSADFSLGLGRGLTDSSDRWVLKATTQFDFR